MRLGADSTMRLVNSKRDFNPKLILDVGKSTKLSSLELFRKYPEAKILSYQYDYSNFLVDSTALAYHDNIVFKYFNIASFHIDDFVFGIVDRSATIDLMLLDVNGKEKDIFKFAGIWPEQTRRIKARLYKNYDYREAKDDLRALGFRSYAKYDNESFYVIGERLET